MDKELFETFIKKLHEQYREEAPETYECSCKLGLTYDRNSECCKDCYGSQKMHDKLLETAIKTGNDDLALFLMFAGHSSKTEEENDNN